MAGIKKGSGDPKKVEKARKEAGLTKSKVLKEPDKKLKNLNVGKNKNMKVAKDK